MYRRNPAVVKSEADRWLGSLGGYLANADYTQISKLYRFTNFHETMAFVNALAYIAYREDHHPDLLLTYKECRVSWGTHAIGGLSENDFICAAKVEALLR